MSNMLSSGISSRVKMLKKVGLRTFFCLALFLIIASPTFAASKIDQDWLDKLPGGSKIKIKGELQQRNKTASGRATIDGKDVEIAAGEIENGQVVMWRVKNFELASIHKKLDVFPVNEITIPDVLMVLCRGTIQTRKVSELPGKLKTFAKKVLKNDDRIIFNTGVNIYGSIKPNRLPKNVKKAFSLLGAENSTILLGGSIGNILTSSPEPALDLYAALPKFKYPEELKKVFKVQGNQTPTLFIGATSKGADVSVRFGVTNDVKMIMGKKSFEFNSTLFLEAEKDKIGVNISLAKDKWERALGIRKLNLQDVKIQVGLSAVGSATFNLRGTLLLDKRPNSLAIATAINTATGLPDPSELLFAVKTRELSLKQFMAIADIFMSTGKGKISSMARKNGGLYKALNLKALPTIKLTGFRRGEDLEIILSGPNASDPDLGIDGLAVKVKAKLFVWDSVLGKADVEISENGLKIFGKSSLKEIGPVKLDKTGAEVVIDCKALIGESPYLKLRTTLEVIGNSGEGTIELSAKRIRASLDVDLSKDLGKASIIAQTDGKKLSKANEFTIHLNIEQDIVGQVIDRVLDGVKAAYSGVSKGTLKDIGDRLKKDADFFQLKRVAITGTTSLRGRDSLKFSAVAMIAGKEQTVSAKLAGLDKGAIGKALDNVFQELGSRLFAFKLPSFDKDIIRKRSDELYFYEGNNCTQEIVGTATYDFGKGKPKRINATKKSWFQNDEAKSLLIRKFKKGSSIVLYDDPDGSLKDDVTVITILKDRKKGVCIKSFEESKIASDGSYRIAVLHKNGLDGKVSRLKITPNYKRSDLPSDILFYEGNNCTQGIKGIYNSDKSRVDDCTDTNRCANDEIRSVRLMSWGDDPYSIYVYDRPDGKKKDDWTGILVDPEKMRAGSVCVGTFEKDKDYRYGAVKVDFHRDNGLDGKISRIRINH